jgi:hypothetical protein
MKVKDWLADRGQLPDKDAQLIADQLRAMHGVDDYEYATVTTWEDETAPTNPGFVKSVRCVADSIDEKVIGYVTMGN